jgi:hypothetical protein
MPRLGFESTIQVLERPKKFYALDYVHCHLCQDHLVPEIVSNYVSPYPNQPVGGREANYVYSNMFILIVKENYSTTDKVVPMLD